MSPEIIDQLLGYGSIALQVFGATSILGIIGFLTAYYAFPPNITIEEVKDKTKNNFESRLVVKNIGKIPAFNIILDFSKMNFTVGGISMSDCNSTDCGIPITKLAAGETTEIPALPHIGMPAGTNVNTCDYILKIKYELRLPFYKTIMDKIWHIELRNSGDEFVWQVAMR
jgi:hypothetical protein